MIVVRDSPNPAQRAQKESVPGLLGCNVLRRISTHLLNKLGADGFQHIMRQPNSAVWSSELTLHISETVKTTPGHHVGLAKVAGKMTAFTRSHSGISIMY